MGRRPELIRPVDPFFDQFFRGPFCVVDVETCGAGQSLRLVEMAAVRIEDLRITGVFETLVDPLVRIDNAFIHGVTDSMAYGAPKFAEALPALAAFVKDAVFVAHNARFDIGVLAAEQTRVYGTPPARPQPFVCSVRMARLAMPELGSHRLSNLVRALEIGNAAPHQGLADAYATAQVFIDLAARLRRRGGVDEKLMRKRIIGERPIFIDSIPEAPDGVALKPRNGSMGSEYAVG
ncbi:MAG: 3'-5' exonuclease [Nitrospinae bacterium]|nr:3'-5' exonuclease [Nitrospinota bacterium]